jgi:hypothetical protein
VLHAVGVIANMQVSLRRNASWLLCQMQLYSYVVVLIAWAQYTGSSGPWVVLLVPKSGQQGTYVKSHV